MAHFRFDLQDGQPPVTFSLAEQDAGRMEAFMAQCQKLKDSAAKPVAWISRATLDELARTELPARYVRVHTYPASGTFGLVVLQE